MDLLAEKYTKCLETLICCFWNILIQFFIRKTNWTPRSSSHFRVLHPSKSTSNFPWSFISICEHFQEFLWQENKNNIKRSKNIRSPTNFVIDDLTVASVVIWKMRKLIRVGYWLTVTRWQNKNEHWKLREKNKKHITYRNQTNWKKNNNKLVNLDISKHWVNELEELSAGIVL